MSQSTSSVQHLTSEIRNLVGKAERFVPKMTSFDLKNNTFTKIAVVVGLYAAVKYSYQGLKSLRHYTKLFAKPRTTAQLHSRYGERSWAIVADFSADNAAVNYLSRHGFNLILMGSSADFTNHASMLKDLRDSRAIDIETVEVDWKNSEADISFYKNLYQRFKNYDLGLIVLPRVQITKTEKFTETSSYPPCQHSLLLVSTFLKQLKSRAHRAGIVFNSDDRVDKVEFGKSLQNAACTAVEYFGMGISEEAKDYCDVIINRGNIEKAFDEIGTGTLYCYPKKGS